MELLSTVRWALGREPVQGDLSDLFMVQCGCYILNHWGIGPVYGYD
ncbi:MAG: hypothetical protein IJ026_07815 [Candidatus Methanomethylophilaceae archaeon]|nr:hypothetical protein [Candidatus Methanomethylophilaceae archaeon]